MSTYEAGPEILNGVKGLWKAKNFNYLLNREFYAMIFWGDDAIPAVCCNDRKYLNHPEKHRPITRKSSNNQDSY